MKKWIVGMVAGLMTLSASAQLINDVTFNAVGSAVSTPTNSTLTDVWQGTGTGTFGTTAELEAFGVTDGSSMNWSNMVAAGKSSFGGLGDKFVAGTNLILRSTVRIADFNFNVETNFGAAVGFGIGDGSKIAYMQLRVGGSGSQVQIKADTRSEDLQTTIKVSADTNLNMTAFGWTGLQLRMDVDLETDTYDLFYFREGFDAEWQAGAAGGAYGLADTNISDFVELDKIRIGTSSTAFLPESTISIDQWTIETISKLPPPPVAIDQQFGGTQNKTIETVTIGTFSAQTNDVLVFMAAGQNNKHIQTNAVAWVSGDGGVTEANVLYSKSSTGLWYTKVTTAGTFDINYTKTNTFTTVGAYLVRAADGGALQLDVDGKFLANDPASTNAALTYSFSGASDCVVIEGLATGAAGATPDDVVVDYVNSGNRLVGSGGTYTNVTSLDTSWTVDQTSSTGNVSLVGIAVYAVVPSTEDTPDSLYSDWLGGYSVGAESNLTDDADADLLDNLTEYAFGGEPDNPTMNGNAPVQSQVVDGGTNYLEYVYYERDDAVARGLSSILEVGADLVATNWSTSGIEFIGSGASAVSGYNAVTNRISTDDADKKFLNLQIQFTP